MTYRRDSERTTDIHVASSSSSSSSCPSGSSLAMKTIRRSNEGWIVMKGVVVDLGGGGVDYSTGQLIYVDCNKALVRLPTLPSRWIMVTTDVAECVGVLWICSKE